MGLTAATQQKSNILMIDGLKKFLNGIRRKHWRYFVWAKTS